MAWRIRVAVETTTQADYLYGLGNVYLIIQPEVWVGLTVVCLPTLGPLFLEYLVSPEIEVGRNLI